MRHRYLAGGAFILIVIAGLVLVSVRLSSTKPESSLQLHSESERVADKLEELLTHDFAELYASLGGAQSKEFIDTRKAVSWTIARDGSQSAKGKRGLRITVEIPSATRELAGIPVSITGYKFEN